MIERNGWPALDAATWAATKKSLHLYLQMLGKLRVALSPAQPNWLFTALFPTARGITTGPIPWSDGAIEGRLDVFASAIVLERSNGTARRIDLLPVRPVADVYAAFLAALIELGVVCTLSPIPQEVPDQTRFDEDHRPAEYDPAAVERWFRVVVATAGIFDQWRAHFFGRTGIQLWWGALDIALLLFNGKHVPPPAGRGYLLKYDLDAEMLNAGFYPGDDTSPPFFYGYIFPQPMGAEALPIAPPAATWSEQIKEWVLPYETVRTSADPAAEVRAFLDSLYRLCVSKAGWDASALAYDAPKPVRRP